MYMLASAAEADIAIVSIVLTFVFLTVGVVVHNWRKNKVAAYNARLKQLMIERGMTAREIKEVLEADGHLDKRREDNC
jgi:hypothetical protein